MAASPQAAQAVARKQSQLGQRKAQLAEQEPRQPGESESAKRARTMIGNLANTQQAVAEAQAADIQGQMTIDPVTGDQLLEDQGENILEMSAADLEAQADQQVADALTGATAEALNVTLSELDPQWKDVISYATDQESGLGLPPTATLEDVKNAIDSEINEMTSLVDNARDIISDPNAPSVERKQARRLMRDYGASHLIATDQELAEFEDDVQNAGLVEFDGKMQTAADLADNEAFLAVLHGAAGKLLDNPEASIEELGLESFPQVYEFASKNAAAVVGVLGENRKVLEDLQSTVNSNIALKNSIPANLGIEIASPFSTESIAKDNPNLAIFAPDSPDKVGKTDLTYLAEFDPNQVAKYIEGGDAKSLQDLKEKAAVHRSIGNLNSVEEMSSLLRVDTQRLQTLLTDAMENPNIYGDDHKKIISALDQDSDGQIDDWAAVQQRMQKLTLDGMKDFNLSEIKTPKERYQEKLSSLMPEAVQLEQMDFNKINDLIVQMKEEGINEEDLKDILAVRDQKRDELRSQYRQEQVQESIDRPERERLAAEKEAKRQKDYTDKVVAKEVTQSLLNEPIADDPATLTDYVKKLEQSKEYVASNLAKGHIGQQGFDEQVKRLDDKIKQLNLKIKTRKQGIQSAYER